ncbi:MAG TPA: carbonic anhydrase [Gaiellaceae bacterium]|nr:carbonic anhydrase [Gaiellaceae bacterium]
MRSERPQPEEVLAANERFARAFPYGALAREPARGVAVLTCMDARIEPLRALGLEVGDAAVLRNAGAVVTEDVMRSLAVASALLGVRGLLVVGHTRCGLEGLEREELAARLGAAGRALDPLAFADVTESVRAGVARVRSSPLLAGRLEAAGFVYEVETGRLRHVVG